VRLLDGNTPLGAMMMPLRFNFDKSDKNGIHLLEGILDGHRLPPLPAHATSSAAVKSAKEYDTLKSRLDEAIQNGVQTTPADATLQVSVKYGYIRVKGQHQQETTLSALGTDYEAKPPVWFNLLEDMLPLDVAEVRQSFVDMGMQTDTKKFWQIDIADLEEGISREVRVSFDANGDKIFSCNEEKIIFRAVLALPYHKYSYIMRMRWARPVRTAILDQIRLFLSERNIVINSDSCRVISSSMGPTQGQRFALISWRQVVKTTMIDPEPKVSYLIRDLSEASTLRDLRGGGEHRHRKLQFYLISDELNRRLEAKEDDVEIYRKMILKLMCDGAEYPYSLWQNKDL